MSALPLKADMFSVEIDVRLVPEADIEHFYEASAILLIANAPPPEQIPQSY
jgi:hypothetical protein